MVAAVTSIALAIVLVTFKGKSATEGGDVKVIPPTKSDHSIPIQSSRQELNLPSNSKPNEDGELDEETRNEEKEVILSEIHEASIQYEPSQISVIIPYLAHPEKEVRLAAVDGLIVLGERAAADHLREASMRLEDPREAVIFLDAAELLELPSYRFKREK